MVKAETRNQAFALFMRDGLSLREIAKKSDISRSTLERWSRKDKWVSQRKEYWLTVAQEICSEQARKDISNQRSIAGKLEYLVWLAYSQHMAYYEGKLPRSAIKFSVRDLCRLATSVHQIGLHEVQRAEATSRRTRS